MAALIVAFSSSCPPSALRSKDHIGPAEISFPLSRFRVVGHGRAVSTEHKVLWGDQAKRMVLK